MSAGLYSLAVIAEFLGQRPAEMSKRIELDELPVIRVPAATKAVSKVSLLAFHEWLAGHSTNKPLTVEQLEKELERCALAVLRANQIKTANAAAKKQSKAA